MLNPATKHELKLVAAIAVFLAIGIGLLILGYSLSDHSQHHTQHHSLNK